MNKPDAFRVLTWDILIGYLFNVAKLVPNELKN